MAWLRDLRCRLWHGGFVTMIEQLEDGAPRVVVDECVTCERRAGT